MGVRNWLVEPSHWQHLWRLDDVRTLVAGRSHRLTVVCGGSRNHAQLVGLFDGVFVLTIETGADRHFLPGQRA